MQLASMLHKVQLKCQVCDGEKNPLDSELTSICHLCKDTFTADTICENGHFICPLCRQENARRAIIQHCLESGECDPIHLTMDLLKLPSVAMHGPEHHLLLTAALLTAYCNTKGRDDLAVLLEEANKRSIQVPGGACGFWGICGAAIAAGIFLSIVTEASPFTENTWGMSGQLTAKSGATIAALGGPRCCKRDTFLSLKEAIKFSNDYLQTDFGIQDITCYFFQNNKECKRRKCPYFPVKDGPEISIVGFAQ